MYKLFVSATGMGVLAWAALLTTNPLPAHAGTVAYWRFETGPAGTPVSHTIGDGMFEAAVPDVSGNGNDLSAWSNGGFAGYQYRT
ncbi:MAG TPA: hypothetical protein VII92_09520, partial [Anaerolineae bacterium]